MATFFMVQQLELRLIVDALDDTHQFQLQSGEGRVEKGSAHVIGG